MRIAGYVLNVWILEVRLVHLVYLVYLVYLETREQLGQLESQVRQAVEPEYSKFLPQWQLTSVAV